MIQFYWNDYQEYIPPIITGLKLINDEALLQLLEKAETLYRANENKFIAQRKANDWSPLYKELKAFDELNQLYYSLHDNTISLFEGYVRDNPAEFVRFKRKSFFQKLLGK